MLACLLTSRGGSGAGGFPSAIRHAQVCVKFLATVEPCCRVWGVAESTAERWYQAGCRTLEDVKAKVTNLSVMQQVGLCHYEDFNRRIPRLEVEEAEAIITEAGADALQVGSLA